MLVYDSDRNRLVSEHLDEDLAQKRVSVGGHMWATAARLARDYYAGVLNTQTFIDRCWSLQHNNGSLFNKIYRTDHLNSVLEWQAQEQYDLLVSSFLHSNQDTQWLSDLYVEHRVETEGPAFALPRSQLIVNTSSGNAVYCDSCSHYTSECTPEDYECLFCDTDGESGFTVCDDCGNYSCICTVCMGCGDKADYCDCTTCEHCQDKGDPCGGVDVCAYSPAFAPVTNTTEITGDMLKIEWTKYTSMWAPKTTADKIVNPPPQATEGGDAR
jgi:hypothetical protein